jgi:hypothetical protein
MQLNNNEPPRICAILTLNYAHMKNLLALTLIIFTLTSFGQSRSSGFFKEVGIGAGLQFPEMDYYKNRNSYEFDQGIATQIFATYAFNRMLDLRVSSGYMTIEGTQVVSSDLSETTSLSLIPINAELIINFQSASRRPKSYYSHKSSFSPTLYMGIGAGYNLLTTTYKATIGDEQSLTGSTTTTQVLAGVKLPVGPIVIGLEGQYVLGSYVQSFVLENGNEFAETISISGPRALFSLAYAFGSSAKKTGLHNNWNYYKSSNNSKKLKR